MCVFNDIPALAPTFPRRSFVFNDIRASFFQFTKLLRFCAAIIFGQLVTFQGLADSRGLRGMVLAGDGNHLIVPVASSFAGPSGVLAVRLRGQRVDQARFADRRARPMAAREGEGSCPLPSWARARQ
jgi:hypothetical protein